MTPATAPVRSERIADREAEARTRLSPLAGEYPFTPRFFEHPPGTGAAGALQHFIDEGPSEGPKGSRAVVFVHGNPTWSFAFRGAVKVLSQHRRCVAIDHIGCGLSDKPGTFSYRLERHIENLERLVGSLGLERVTLVLHDWGGPIGLGFARRHPERIESLVLCNTAAFPLDDGLPMRLAACRWPVFGKLAVRGLNAFARGATMMAVEQPLSPIAKRGYLLPYDSWENRIATHEFVADIPLRGDHPSWNELATIDRSLVGFRDLPTLLLWGARDWVFTPRYLLAWKQRLPNARATCFEDAGHYLFEDRAQDFQTELERWILR